jgi:hypothetical protein
MLAFTDYFDAFADSMFWRYYTDTANYDILIVAITHCLESFFTQPRRRAIIRRTAEYFEPRRASLDVMHVLSALLTRRLAEQCRATVATEYAAVLVSRK